MSLTPNQKHLLRLIVKGADEEGWAKISKMLWEFVSNTLIGMEELVELRPDKENDGGYGRITTTGKTVMKYI